MEGRSQVLKVEGKHFQNFYKSSEVRWLTMVSREGHKVL